jgi:hypothetical protein
MKRAWSIGSVDGGRSATWIVVSTSLIGAPQDGQ